jgi:hypothetical protein
LIINNKKERCRSKLQGLETKCRSAPKIINLITQIRHFDELLQDDLNIDKEIDKFLLFAEAFVGASKKHKRDWN